MAVRDALACYGLATGVNSTLSRVPRRLLAADAASYSRMYAMPVAKAVKLAVLLC